MAIKKFNGAYAVYHSKGRKKGKIIKSFRTRSEADAMNAAIWVNKLKKKIKKVKPTPTRTPGIKLKGAYV
jgi:hypothetical protein